MDAARQRELVFAAAALGGLLVLGPLRHQALQARYIEQPARQRRGFEAARYRARSRRVLALSERNQVGLLAPRRRSSMISRGSRSAKTRRAKDRGTPLRRYIGSGTASANSSSRRSACGSRASQPTISPAIARMSLSILIVIEHASGAPTRRVPIARTEPRIEALLAPTPRQTGFGDEGGVQRAMLGDAVGIAAAQPIDQPAHP